MRKTFIDNLPRKNNRIDWKNSVGYNVNFIYNDINGIIKIIDYDSENRKITVEYNYIKNTIMIDSFRLGKIAFVLGLKACDFKYKVGDIINDCKTIKRNLIILEQFKKMNSNGYTRRWYKYHCCECGYDGTIREYSLDEGGGCSICSHKSSKIQVGINDIWTTNPELAKLLANPEDGYKYTEHSNKIVDWHCPNCGNIIKSKKINQINEHGLSCPVCSDGISYPEKFMYNLLKQLNIYFEYQKRFDWQKKLETMKQCRYDFYIPSKQIIIEMDGGLGHGNCDTKNLTSKESRNIDNKKDRLAKKHNVEVIRVDCNYKNSNRFNYILNSILSSELNGLFNFTSIKWEDINRISNKSLLKDICQDKLLHPEKSTVDIGKKFNLERTTIAKYLKTGTNLGWCNYDPQEDVKIKVGRSGKLNSKRVICLTTNEIFDSTIQASKKKNICQSAISMCCNNKHKTAGKLKWMFVDEYMLRNGYTEIEQIPKNIYYTGEEKIG